MSFLVKASLSLNVIVVGGGISGLAVAFRLAQAGHAVRVIDKSRPEQKAYGVRVPPNLTKILEEWGLGEQVARWGKPTRKSHCYSMETGQFVGHLLWPPTEVLEEIGAEYFLMHYRDLYAMLHSVAKSAGVELFYDTLVSKVSANPPRVELASGMTLHGDLIVGADGSCGIVRETVEGTSSTDGDGQRTMDGLSICVATIPRDRLRKDPELDIFTNPDIGGPQHTIWMGTSSHASGFPVHDNSEYAVHIFFPDSLVTAGEDLSEEWDFSMPTEKLHFSGDSKLERLLDLCPVLQRKSHSRREPAVEWADESGRIILMGGAAHPSLPCAIYSTSLSIEDAEVLGGLLSRLSSWNQLPQLVEAFQELREDRCRAVQEQELVGLQLVWLPPGVSRDERDELLRATITPWPQGRDEDEMRLKWEEINEVFGYSAREAAEDWWVSWGILRERSLPTSPYEYVRRERSGYM